MSIRGVLAKSADSLLTVSGDTFRASNRCFSRTPEDNLPTMYLNRQFLVSNHRHPGRNDFITRLLESCPT